VATTETRQFAREQTGALLRSLDVEIGHAVQSCTPDAVHDVRVAIRRFGQSIAVFKPCFPGKDVRKIRRRLKDVMKTAGHVRDCDVALKLLAKSRLPNGAIPAKVRARRKDAARVLVGELKSWTDRQMSIKWRAALEAAIAKNGGDFGTASVDANAGRILRRMTKDFFQSGNDAAGAKATPQDLHKFRIVAKKFRYSLELFAPVYGAVLESRLARMKEAQSLLGDVNDCETVGDLVAELGGGGGLVARLKKRQRKKTGEFRQFWRADFQGGEHLQSWEDALRSHPMRKPAARAGSLSSRKTATSKA